VFFGFRAPALQEQPDDDEAARADKRSQFFDELGQTFMPGTPLMQAPLGLAAYLPAVIDPPAGSGLPDEAAIIAYASLDIYQSTRETSLSRRMYTRSHAAVFDMGAAVSGFPTPAGSPTRVASSVGDVSFWHLFDHETDWQDGDARFLFLLAGSGDEALSTAVTEKAQEAADALRDGGCDQMIGGCADAFAALWLHAPTDAGAIDPAVFVPDGAAIFRDLRFQPSWVRGDAERGISIKGPGAHNWRFARDLRHFV
jgi:hypothetical protein